MDTKNFEEKLEKEFHVSRAIIVYKFLLGLIELVLGFGIIFFGKQSLELYNNFKAQELLEDPHDLLVGSLENIIPYISAHQGFIVFILLLLGFTKVAGSIGLFYHKHWGLDLLVAITILLLPFDTYETIFHFSLGNFTFFVINILIALYLVNFKPVGYFSNLKSRIGS